MVVYILISFKIIDRNPNVRFYKYMVAIGLQKSPVYDFVHSQSYIRS